MTHPYDSKPYDRVHVGGGDKTPLTIQANDFVAGPPQPSELPFVLGPSEPNGADRKRAVQHRADQKMQMAILERLKEVLINHGDGTYSYTAPWDDRGLSVALGCKPGHITYRRVKAFGPFPDDRPASDPFGERALRLVLDLYRELGLTVPD